MRRIRNKLLVPAVPAMSAPAAVDPGVVGAGSRCQIVGRERGDAPGAFKCLADLPRGQAALVLDLDVDTGLRHRLQALGLGQGQRVQVLRRAWCSGPIHLRVGMTELMLRRRDAARISVQPLEERP